MRQYAVTKGILGVLILVRCGSEIDVNSTCLNKAGEAITGRYAAGEVRLSKSSTSQRTLQGFVSSSTATSKLTGEAFFTGFTSGTGPASPKWSGLGSGRLDLTIDFWDALLTAALDGQEILQALQLMCTNGPMS